MPSIWMSERCWSSGFEDDLSNFGDLEKLLPNKQLATKIWPFGQTNIYFVSLSLFVCLLPSLSLCPTISLSIRLTFHFSVYLSIFITVCLLVLPTVRPSVCLRKMNTRRVWFHIIINWKLKGSHFSALDFCHSLDVFLSSVKFSQRLL